MKPVQRFIAAFLTLGSLTLPALAVPAAAQDLQLASAEATTPVAENLLKPIVSVRGDTIRVSDLFSGPIPRGDRAILSAPEPGLRRVIDARLLSRIARTYGLSWRPVSADIQAVVTRQSQIITHEDILANIRWALENEGAPENADIMVTASSLAVALPVDATPSVNIGNLFYAPQSNSFKATIDVTATQDDRVVFTRQVAVGGRIYETEKVPVLTDTLRRGDVIEADDVVYKNIRSKLVRDSAVTDIDKLIGKEVRRTIKSGKPISASQVQNLTMVRKGETVVVYFALRTMNLTAKGKAMESGGQGDIIRVLNTKSNRTVLAKVVRPNQVVVDLGTQTVQR